LPQLFVDWILALELWMVSLGLFAISIGLAIEVHARFSRTFRQMEDRRLKAVRGRMREIIARAEKSRMEDIEDRILGMQDQYVSAKAPRRALMESVEYFFFASVLYLVSVLVRAGMDYGWMPVQSYSPAEAILFLMGLVFFAIACLSAYRFMRLVEHESVD
jgi:hypothetical protein